MTVVHIISIVVQSFTFMATAVRWIVKTLITVVLLGAIGFGLWFWGAMKYVFSSGERAGYVQKFSKRGWIFKTWEGELAMVNLPGAMPEKFDFSVIDGAVAQKLSTSLGQRVVLKYEQHRFIPLPIFAETEYFVTDVLQVENAVPPPPLPASADRK